MRSISISSRQLQQIASIGIVLLGFAAPSRGTEIDWAQHKIEVSGLSDQQRQVLENTFDQFRSIRLDELKIDRGLYRRLSRYDKLFGKPLNGDDLAEWVLSRLRKIVYGNTSLAAINQNRGELWVGDSFFEAMTPLERLYLLVHEARHSDGDGYPHVRCPKGFRFVSAGQPWMHLDKEKACDRSEEGAYAYQAAFLFELFAYGFFDQREVGLLYNSTVARILR